MGLWTSPATDSSPEFTLNLKQADKKVTGKLKASTDEYPVIGNFDGTTLRLDFPDVPETNIFATVSGNIMIGTIGTDDEPNVDFTATKQVNP